MSPVVQSDVWQPQFGCVHTDEPNSAKFIRIPPESLVCETNAEPRVDGKIAVDVKLQVFDH